jgi:hypothetical protein
MNSVGIASCQERFTPGPLGFTHPQDSDLQQLAVSLQDDNPRAVRSILSSILGGMKCSAPQGFETATISLTTIGRVMRLPEPIDA